MIDPQVAVIVCTLELAAFLLVIFFGSFALWVSTMNDANGPVMPKIGVSALTLYLMPISVLKLMALFGAVQS